MRYIKRHRRTSCPEVSLCSSDEMLYSLCQRVYLVINTPHIPNKRDVFLLCTFYKECISLLFYKNKLLLIML